MPNTYKPSQMADAIHHLPKGGIYRIEPLTATYNGIYTAPEGKGYSPVTVNIFTELKPVLFLDYDGSILYSYTTEEFASLVSLPANPSHENLVSQGWNWTLSDAKTYLTTHDSLVIGQMYTTISEATEIDITLKAPNLSPYLIITVSSPITIDWGDESEIDQITQAGQRAIQHTYSIAGNYTISISGDEASFTFDGNFYSANAGVLYPTNTPSKSTLYSSTIKAIRLGDNAVIGEGAFASCTQLESITIPSGATIIEKIAFYRCLSLKEITIPNTVTKLELGSFSGCSSLVSACIPNSVVTIEGESFNSCKELQNVSLPASIATIKQQAFNGCSSLSTVILPSSITTLEDRVFANCATLYSAEFTHSGTIIPNNIFASCGNLTSVVIPNTTQYIRDNAFSGCFSLQSITLPSTVIEINANAFANCSSLSEIHFRSTTPPTVTNSNAFSGLPSNCIIYVPIGKLSTYTSATNYPSSSTYTYVEE